MSLPCPSLLWIDSDIVNVDRDSEAEREAIIAKNRALLAELDVTLDIPKRESPRPKAKPVQPSKKIKRESVPAVPLRQSTRLKRSLPDANESPAKRRKREVCIIRC